MFLQPAAARRVEAGLHADYDPTALFWRCAPDYGVRPQSGGRSWLAEVKGPSERWANLVLEATQLMNLYLLAQCLWLDIRYVYAAPEQPLRCQSVERVLECIDTVYVNPDHPSVARWPVVPPALGGACAAGDRRAPPSVGGEQHTSRQEVRP